MHRNDLGAHIQHGTGLARYVLAGGGLDGVEQLTDAFDRSRFGSAVVAVEWETVHAGAGTTLTLGVNRYESDDGGATWGAAIPVMAPEVVFTSAGGALTADGRFELDEDLTGSELTVRYGVTATLSAAGVDTATVGACVVFGGADTIPA